MPTTYNPLLVGAPDASSLEFVSGAPSGGNEGDTKVRVDAPMIGVLSRKVSGNWTNLSNTYTWASRPAAGSYAGAVITISDWNQDFFSDGVNWIPVGKFVTLTRNHTLSSATFVAGAGGTSFQGLVSVAIPAGLILPNCVITAYGGWEYGLAGGSTPVTTGTGSKNHCIRVVSEGTVMLMDRVGTGASSEGAIGQVSLFVSGTSIGTQYAKPASNGDTDFFQGSSAGLTTHSVDFSVAQSIEWGVKNAATTDGVRMKLLGLEVRFP